jgi:hypothetical protein
MRETLDNSEKRPMFHLFNNGITAVCRDLSFTEYAIEGNASYRIDIRGMQVVNGCQTTETLWDWARHEPEAARGTYVMLRLVKEINEEFTSTISRTTNTQSAILGTDVVANSSEQKRIKESLQHLPDRPIFYENRRGGIKKLSAADKERFVLAVNEWGDPNSRQYRIIKMRELAQALQAVTGLPEQAKEGIAGVFKPNNDRYNWLFKNCWEDGAQVALVADLYKFTANGLNWMKREWYDQNSTLDSSLRERYTTLAKLGRFYIIHLVYEYLRDPTNPFGVAVANDEEDGRRRPLLLAEDSQLIRENLKSRVGPSLVLAVDTLRAVREDRDHPVDGDRALLRQASHKSRIQQRFRDSVIQWNLR